MTLQKAKNPKSKSRASPKRGATTEGQGEASKSAPNAAAGRALPARAVEEIFPYGLTIGTEGTRPLMLFESEGGRVRVPIWLSSVDAHLTASYMDYRSGQVPHGVLADVLSHWQARVECCVFDSVEGHRQSGELVFKGWELQSLRRPAADLVTVGLSQKARFFVTPEFVVQSREIQVDMSRLEAEIAAFPQEARSNHPYLI